MNTLQIRVVFDRKKQATKTKQGLLQLECRLNSERRFISTGIRLLSTQWKDGRVVNHIDADNINLRIAIIGWHYDERGVIPVDIACVLHL